MLVIVADTKYHDEWAIIMYLTGRLMCLVQAMYCWLAALYSNSNLSWANFDPNERMAV